MRFFDCMFSHRQEPLHPQIDSILVAWTTAPRGGQIGKLRFNQMAMLPFYGNNVADDFNQWRSIGTTSNAKKLPQIGFVNWFRRDDNSHLLWPGCGENSRVVKSVFKHLDCTAQATRTATGFLLTNDVPDNTGVNVSMDDLKRLLSADAKG